MKLKKRPVAIILILCLICSLVNTGFADDCYESMKSGFNTMLPEAFSVAEGETVTGDTVDNTVYLLYDLDKQILVLGGENASGEDEATLWYDICSDDGIVILYIACQYWDLFEGYLDEGSSLVLGIVSEDEGHCLFMRTAEEAAGYMERIDTFLEGYNEPETTEAPAVTGEGYLTDSNGIVAIPLPDNYTILSGEEWRAIRDADFEENKEQYSQAERDMFVTARASGDLSAVAYDNNDSGHIITLTTSLQPGATQEMVVEKQAELDATMQSQMYLLGGGEYFSRIEQHGENIWNVTEARGKTKQSRFAYTVIDEHLVMINFMDFTEEDVSEVLDSVIVL